MIQLPMRAIDSLLYVEPTYVLTEGTDVELAIEFSSEWDGKAITALFRREDEAEEVAVEGGRCRVPRSMMALPRFSVTILGEQGEERINTQRLEIYVGPTISPTEGGQDAGA